MHDACMQINTKDILMLGTITCCFSLCRYTVMSGTPEKILEHLLDTVKLDSNGNDAIGEPAGIFTEGFIMIR